MTALTAGGEIPRRLFFYTGGFLREHRLRRMLTLAGHQLCLGLPQKGDGVVVWGRSPYAARGEAVAAKRGVPVIRIEDAFLRSIRPGRMGDAPIGLMIDGQGVHFDSTTPSRLETLLARADLSDAHLLHRARVGIERLRQLDLSKYNLHDPALAPPAPGYVLVIDQTRGDASIHHAGATQQTFREMLVRAQEDHSGVRVIIKTHPETAQGLRPGHFGPADATGRVSLLTDAMSPHSLLEGAIAVYTVSSQMGFEAILAGHRPRVFGQPFYVGWGLTEDENPVARRHRALTRTQLFAAAMILAPVWYDPCRDRLCRFEEAVDQLEAEVRAFREDRRGHVAVGMRLWKRRPLQKVFGREKPLIFIDNPIRAAQVAAEKNRSLLIWANRDATGLLPRVARVEDGFLRSRGLGADLIPPLSLVTDDLGIYYDPRQESRLERLILSPPPAGGRERAEALVARLIAANLSKYNLSSPPLPPLPEGHRILVPGQVEDDASIITGGGDIRTNLGLLRAARAANPMARILYKPHPDVEAGLRKGAIPRENLAGLADAVLDHADPIRLLAEVDEVWTMTSLLGFEALLRGKPVTCLGAPFYAGWGLTRDLGPVPHRRLRRPDGSLQPRPDLLHLAHAALIAYPRYFDPLTNRPCPPEVIIDRLTNGPLPHPGFGNRLLAKAQGKLTSYAWLWR